MTPYPRHEAELERRAYADLARALRHPRELPALARASWRQNGDYFAGRDLGDLGREELVELVAWTRRAAVELAGLALLLGLLAVAFAVGGCREWKG